MDVHLVWKTLLLTKQTLITQLKQKLPNVQNHIGINTGNLNNCVFGHNIITVTQPKINAKVMIS